jgi:hypothetical protein
VVLDVLAVVAVLDGARRAFHIPIERVAVAGLAVVVLIAMCWALERFGRAHGVASARRWLLGGALAAVLLAAGGYALERRYLRHRLAGEDAAVDFFIAHARDGDRVGLAEHWTVVPPSPVFAMFGPRLDNRVTYVGRRVDGVNRPQHDRAQFLAQSRREGYDWLMVGRGARPYARTPAMDWAVAGGYKLVADSPRLALYRAVAHPP